MEKINHAERVMAEARDKEFLDNLTERAAGADEAELAFQECRGQLEGWGVDLVEAGEILLQYGMAMQANGFNAGFDLGFSEGALLGRYGRNIAPGCPTIDEQERG